MGYVVVKDQSKIVICKTEITTSKVSVVEKSGVPLCYHTLQRNVTLSNYVNLPDTPVVSINW